jgi:hypothetical protein
MHRFLNTDKYCAQSIILEKTYFYLWLSKIFLR